MQAADLPSFLTREAITGIYSMPFTTTCKIDNSNSQKRMFPNLPKELSIIGRTGLDTRENRRFPVTFLENYRFLKNLICIKQLENIASSN